MPRLYLDASAPGEFDSYAFRVTIARMRLEAGLHPHPARRRLMRGDVCYCPLCGFLLADDLDGHFPSCLLRHLVEVCYG